MTISFNAIPVDIRTPGTAVEFDASRARGGLPMVQNRVLIIGQRIAGGSAPNMVPQRIFGGENAAALFGRASIITRTIAAFRAADSVSECWAVALQDLVAGTQATGTITVTGPASAAGTIKLMFAGQKVAVAVANASVAATIATAIAAAVNANTALPVTAAAVAAVVTLTARHKGTAGNAIDVRHSFYQGDALPAGVTLAIVAMAAGAGDPDHEPLWDVIRDSEYRTIILAHSNAEILTSLDAEMEDRFGPARMLESYCWTARAGDAASLAAYGDARNGRLVTSIGTGKSPTPSWEWAGALGGIAGYYSAIDPARPLQTLRLPGIIAPAEPDRFTRAERETLLRAGIATYLVDTGGNVLIERTVTMYQADAFGEPDTSFLDAETILTLSYLRLAVRARFQAKYPRHKLASDSTRFAAGQAIVTPLVLRGEYIALFRELEEAGLVENLDQFKADLIVERDASDPNRVNCLVPPDLVNQLRVIAAQVQFRA